MDAEPPTERERGAGVARMYPQWARQRQRRRCSQDPGRIHSGRDRERGAGVARMYPQWARQRKRRRCSQDVSTVGETEKEAPM
eukprot:1195847-Prorocentrum_minimum.AAC.3